MTLQLKCFSVTPSVCTYAQHDRHTLVCLSINMKDSTILPLSTVWVNTVCDKCDFIHAIRKENHGETGHAVATDISLVPLL